MNTIDRFIDAGTIDVAEILTETVKRFEFRGIFKGRVHLEAREAFLTRIHGIRITYAEPRSYGEVHRLQQDFELPPFFLNEARSREDFKMTVRHWVHGSVKDFLHHVFEAGIYIAPEEE